jgi:transposase
MEYIPAPSQEPKRILSHVHFPIPQHPPGLSRKIISSLTEQRGEQGEHGGHVFPTVRQRRSSPPSTLPPKMAPRLPPSKLEMIRDMIYSGSLTESQMAKAAECSERSIINIRNNLRLFGNVRAPLTRVGRRRSTTPPMIQTLCDHLLEKPGLYVDEMVLFLWDEFRVWVTSSSLKRALALVGWSKKVARLRARNRTLIYEISTCIICLTSNRIIWFMGMSLDAINESGSDAPAGLHWA